MDAWVQSTSGKTRKRLTVDGFTVNETIHGLSQVIPRHVHDYATIIFVLRGSFEEHVAGRTFRCEPGHLLFRPPLEIHENRYGASGARCLIVALDHNRFRWMEELSTAFSRPVWSNNGHLSSLAVRIHRELCVADRASLLGAEGLLLELLAHATRQFDSAPRTAKLPEWLGRMRELLHAGFRENLCMANIAATAGVHPVHAARAFRRHYGCSVGEYVRRLRVESACHTLTTTATPLAQVALEAGFSAQSHFSSVFKRMTGTTPAEYRATFQRA
jgi:AraC family transcriptional regulator